jgi:hypothetical protein
VIAERDHVGASGEDAGRELGGDPDAVRGVLAVDDAERRAELLPQPAQPLLDRPPARRTDDVADEQDLQRIESAAAGRTDSDTLLPASCV